MPGHAGNRALLRARYGGSYRAEGVQLPEQKSAHSAVMPANWRLATYRYPLTGQSQTSLISVRTLQRPRAERTVYELVITCPTLYVLVPAWIDMDARSFTATTVVSRNSTLVRNCNSYVYVYESSYHVLLVVLGTLASS